MSAQRTYPSLFVSLLLTIALFAGSYLAPIHAQSASSTPRPGSTPSATPVPAIQLPDWIRDPNAAVAALFIYDDPYDETGAWTFINAETGERFALSLSYVDDVGWVDAADGVYIRLTRYLSSGADNSDGFNEYVDLISGRLVRLALGDDRAPASRPRPSLFPVENGGNFGYRLEANASFLPVSAETTTYQLFTSGRIVVSNLETGETVHVSGLPQSGLRQVTVQWFGEGRYLGIGYIAPFLDGDYDVVSIVDSSGGEPLYFEGLRQPRWSEQHSLMLYRDQFQEDAICLRNIEERNLTDIDCDLFDSWEYRRQIQDYQWSHYGQRIIFTYTAEDEQSGGLCIVDVATRTIDCPVRRSVNNRPFSGVYRYYAGNAHGVYSFRNVLSESDYARMDIPREASLCLVSEVDYTTDCITDRILPAETAVNWTSLSPSGDALAVMYTGQNYTPHDGICIIQLQSGDVSCPDTSAIDGYIEAGAWSADSRFFLAMYTAYGSFSDDKTGTRFGILDIAAGTYRDEGFGPYHGSLNEQWRPALHP